MRKLAFGFGGLVLVGALGGALALPAATSEPCPEGKALFELEILAVKGVPSPEQVIRQALADVKLSEADVIDAASDVEHLGLGERAEIAVADTAVTDSGKEVSNVSVIIERRANDSLYWAEGGSLCTTPEEFIVTK